MGLAQYAVVLELGREEAGAVWIVRQWKVSKLG
jgi:hypothetical protein